MQARGAEIGLARPGPCRAALRNVIAEEGRRSDNICASAPAAVTQPVGCELAEWLLLLILGINL